MIRSRDGARAAINSRDLEDSRNCLTVRSQDLYSDVLQYHLAEGSHAEKHAMPELHFRAGVWSR